LHSCLCENANVFPHYLFDYFQPYFLSPILGKSNSWATIGPQFSEALHFLFQSVFSLLSSSNFDCYFFKFTDLLFCLSTLCLIHLLSLKFNSYYQFDTPLLLLFIWWNFRCICWDFLIFSFLLSVFIMSCQSIFYLVTFSNFFFSD
jgi:hypothetical protein